MAMKIRLARGGSKKRPFYRIVAADSRMPRDGRFKRQRRARKNGHGTCSVLGWPRRTGY